MTPHLHVSVRAQGDSQGNAQWPVLVGGQGGALPVTTEVLLLSDTFPKRKILHLAKSSVMLAVPLQVTDTPRVSS